MSLRVTNIDIATVTTTLQANNVFQQTVGVLIQVRGPTAAGQGNRLVAGNIVIPPRVCRTPIFYGIDSTLVNTSMGRGRQYLMTLNLSVSVKLGFTAAERSRGLVCGMQML